MNSDIGTTQLKLHELAVGDFESEFRILYTNVLFLYKSIFNFLIVHVVSPDKVYDSPLVMIDTALVLVSSFIDTAVPVSSCINTGESFIVNGLLSAVNLSILSIPNVSLKCISDSDTNFNLYVRHKSLA